MKCVSTVSYSLLLNGGLTEKFEARKGLRQGDPMSPYLFVIAMEYLNKALKTLTKIPYFNFHPKCSKLQIVHICFVDNLLMCCRADEVSMKMLMRCFKQFSEVFGLHAFKYLGIPLAAKKISIQQCMPVVERIMDRIRSWTSNFLSYAGILQFIKSVLFEMQTYWAQVFLIPKKIVKMVNGICRRICGLDGSNENSQRNPISWDTLCKPKAAGGLNIINYERWNKAAITKLLWAVVNKKDKLWIKWIHGQYIKRKDITSMEVPKQASWLVRKIFNAREWWANDMQEYSRA